MTRASWLCVWLLLPLACDGKFAFDSSSSQASEMGGAGLAAAGSGGLAQTEGGSSGQGSNVSEGGNGTSGGSVSEGDCAARCASAQLKCLDSAQSCVECSMDSDCLAIGGRRCDSSGQTANRCVDCLADSDCASGQQCEQQTHLCVTTCNRDRDPSCQDLGLECNLRHGYCAACQQDRDCPSHLHCIPGHARCAQCVVDSDCDVEPGGLCDPVLFLCVECRDSLDCPSSGAVCDPWTHRCN